MSGLRDEDLGRLAVHGISAGEAERQLRLLRQPPSPLRLERPCAPGDGIERFPPERRQELVHRYETAAAGGRLQKFVPASGAASRMFASLQSLLQTGSLSREQLERLRDAGDPAAADGLRLLDELERFPFSTALERVRGGADPRDLAVLLPLLLGSRGLGLADLPKGLLPFHRYAEGSRTAFEEHFAEAARYLVDEEGVCRQHFTVGPEHRHAFELAAREAASRLGPHTGCRFETGFSEQSPATDTLALDASGEPFRDGDGRLLLRPGGHGALLGNLQATGADLVFVKNIDNILPEAGQRLVVEWKQSLGGRLVELVEEIAGLLAEAAGETAESSWVDRARQLSERALGWPALEPDDLAEPARAVRQLAARLDRPLRVCGVVPNAGEPGGGPFWVVGHDGVVRRQIVEAAEIDASDPEQIRRFAAATHFNPVDLVCSLRDWRGRPFELARFVDDEAIFLSHRSHGGRDLVALERPGLWNGAMAGWNTVFVEVPGGTFAPVKTIFDLLRPEHQGGSEAGGW